MTDTPTTSIAVRVYYEDTDAGGIVYYANYLKYAERGRTELLRSLGFENKALMESSNLLFVVRHLEADYMSGAKLDDLLDIHTSVVEIRNASFTMYQTVSRSGEILFTLRVKLACINTDGRPVRAPDNLKTALAQAAYEEGK